MVDKIAYDREKPDIMRIDGAGRIEYYEFENDIWVSNYYADSRGKGIKLIREMIRYARAVKKNIYGQVNVKENSWMSNDRLRKLYEILGAKPIHMKDHPTAMKLEIK